MYRPIFAATVACFLALSAPAQAKPNPPGWPFRFSCDTAIWYADTFSLATLDQMRRAAGMREFTPAELKILEKCVGKRR